MQKSRLKACAIMSTSFATGYVASIFFSAHIWMITATEYTSYGNAKSIHTIQEFCSWKRTTLNDHGISAELKERLDARRKIYVGSSGKTWFGWESLGVSELDITNSSNFNERFCVGDVQAFLSEHTFEHIEPHKMEIAFSLFYKYLRPGGHVRTAIPIYPGGHQANTVDKKYGHVNFVTADGLVALMENLGFVNVRKLEWVDFAAGTVHSTYWDVCEGPIQRSIAFDARNAEFHVRNCKIINRTTAMESPHLNSFLAENVWPVSDAPPTRSVIVQGHKPIDGS